MRKCLVQHARCENGRIVLPGGSYRILHLVHCDKLRPQTLTRIGELVERGATVVGPKPTGVSGREGYPDSDRQVREMADHLWGKVDGKSTTQRTVWTRAESSSDVIRRTCSRKSACRPTST